MFVEAGDLFTSMGHTTAATVTDWLVTAVGIWIPIYLLISLRVVFQQNWFMTISKFMLIGISYVALLLVVTTGVAIASFVLL